MPKLAASLAQAPAESISAASGGWSEGDIFELYQEWLNSEGSSRAEWVVRANQDRVLVDVKKGAPTRLFDAMRAAPLLGEIEFDVAAKTGSKKITNL